MDDANVPSLLSMPYLGYRSPHDPDGAIANNTRRFVLSEGNRYFYTGTTTHAPYSLQDF
jgi:meiotically up-regulated gene 157 (Mug157) protein